MTTALDRVLAAMRSYSSSLRVNETAPAADASAPVFSAEAKADSKHLSASISRTIARQARRRQVIR